MMDYTYGHSSVLILLAFTVVSPLVETCRLKACAGGTGRKEFRTRRSLAL
jgi:hypothetical protein